MYKRPSYLCVFLKEIYKIILHGVIEVDVALQSMKKTMKPHVFLFL